MDVESEFVTSTSRFHNVQLDGAFVANRMMALLHPDLPCDKCGHVRPVMRRSVFRKVNGEVLALSQRWCEECVAASGHR